VESGSDSAQQ